MSYKFRYMLPNQLSTFKWLDSESVKSQPSNQESKIGNRMAEGFLKKIVYKFLDTLDYV